MLSPVYHLNVDCSDQVLFGALCPNWFEMCCWYEVQNNWWDTAFFKKRSLYCFHLNSMSKSFRKWSHSVSFMFHSAPQLLLDLGMYIHLVWEITWEILYTNSVRPDYTYHLDIGRLILWHNMLKHKLNLKDKESLLCPVTQWVTHIFVCILRTTHCWFKPHSMAAKLLYNVFCFWIQWYYTVQIYFTAVMGCSMHL